MTTSSSPDGSRISRRVLFQAAGALGLSAAGSTCPSQVWTGARRAPRVIDMGQARRYVDHGSAY
jgi:hypothetical protein